MRPSSLLKSALLAAFAGFLSGAAAPAPAQSATPAPPTDIVAALPSTVKPYDPAEDLLRRKELADLRQEVQEVLDKHPGIAEKLPDDFALALLKVEKCAILVERYVPGDVRDATFRKLREEARSVLASLAEGKKWAVGATGLVERAYLSDVDGSAQPYYVYIPEKLDLKKPAPLLLFLHGWSPEIDKINWLDLLLSESAKACADQLGAVLLVPFARSNTDFQGLGERDVLATIEHTERLYNIDADRVWLTGCSMGGSGVWCVAAHYPDIFAAAVPAAGRTDYNLWQNIPRGEFTPFKQFLIDRDFAVTLAPNFRNLPVFAFHGEDDTIVQTEQSKNMIKTLRGMGFEAILHLFEKGDHWTCFDAYKSDLLLGWLPAKQLARRPARVTYRTYHPRFNRAYWTTIDDFAEYGKPAEIDVKTTGKAAVSVKTQNVARFTLDFPTGPGAPDRVMIDVGSARLDKAVPKSGRVTVELTPVDEAGLRKRGELCGPVYEAYQQPFMMVWGSLGGPEKTDAAQNTVMTAMVEWLQFAAGAPRVKKDTDVTDSDIRQFNLVIFGTPATNALLKRIADKLPVKIDEGKFTVGAKVYEGADLGLGLVYPNPLNPSRCVVVWSGIPWGSALSKNHKLDLLPDYIVFDDTISPTNSTNNFKVAGFFDINWKLDEKLMWFGPEPAPMQIR